MNSVAQAMKKFLETLDRARLTKRDRDGIESASSAVVDAFGTAEYIRGKQDGIALMSAKRERTRDGIRVELLEAVKKALGIDE